MQFPPFRDLFFVMAATGHSGRHKPPGRAGDDDLAIKKISDSERFPFTRKRPSPDYGGIAAVTIHSPKHYELLLSIYHF
jgi:hypothetical protein